MKCPECQNEIHLGMTTLELAVLEQKLEDFCVIMVCVDCYRETQEMLEYLQENI